MKERLLRIVAYFVALTAMMILLKPFFMLIVGGYSFGDVLSVMSHGIAMDCTVAGYLTAIPALLTIASTFVNSQKLLGLSFRIYNGLIATLLALIYVADAALYPYWGFRLDTTPLFYFATSPSAAMASIEWWQWILGIIAIAALWTGIFLLFNLICRKVPYKPVAGAKRRCVATAVLIIAAGLLFIPIRGGFTVSTMNLSRAYFSSDMRLNHAAINPAFSLMYSATHSGDFGKQFRFLDNETAESIVASLKNHEPSSAPLDGKPDICLIILESFSANLMPSLGGEPIAMNLDSIAASGWLFTDIYASSVRTDRALPAILNGYPAQPTTSILKFVGKLGSLPSLASSLSENGYATTYYYGGDINYANINALLVAGGFGRIVSDKDFPVNQRMSKWGVHDGPLFDLVASDIAAERSDQPKFRVIQTSSSHEPFKVPYTGGSDVPAVNAFEYTDSLVGAFLRNLDAAGELDNTLVVIVPDHQGAYPTDIQDPIRRHHIPLIFTGGAIRDVYLDDSLLNLTGSQTDIAATILGMLGIDHSDFAFSNDLTAPSRRPFAFFSQPSWIAMKADSILSQIAVDTLEPMREAPDSIDTALKAYIQTIYTDLDHR